MDSLRRALKPERHMAIVDFSKQDEMRDHVRLDRDGVVNEVQPFGWKLQAGCGPFRQSISDDDPRNPESGASRRA